MSPYLNQFLIWQVGGSCFAQRGLFSHLTGEFNTPYSFRVIICCTGTAGHLLFPSCAAVLSAQGVPQIYMSVSCGAFVSPVIGKLLADCPGLTVQVTLSEHYPPLEITQYILPTKCSFYLKVVALLFHLTVMLLSVTCAWFV